MNLLLISLIWLLARVGLGLAAPRGEGLPLCSIDCVFSYYNGCYETDPRCICRSTTYINKAAECTYKACPRSDFEAVARALQERCASVGIEVQVPRFTYPTPSPTPTRYTYTSQSSEYRGAGPNLGQMLAIFLVAVPAFFCLVTCLPIWLIQRHQEKKKEREDPEVLVVPMNNLTEEEVKDLGGIIEGSDKPVTVDLQQRVHVYIGR
ncbi:hypothetical protein EYR41_007955 [Orbilia oligospora]|uniref:CFEM domain-containing protein n=1 Tax=Orbilia oligospora TaxID=2813651 RepID=A0A8H2DU43_ORBOL|nr:hypothetical protein EYR41_007955 [Orbilia oligospora]